MKTDTPRTDALIYPNGLLATNLLEHARELERELIKVTKERNDAMQAYIVLDASYKMIRDSNRQLRKAFESL